MDGKAGPSSRGGKASSLPSLTRREESKVSSSSSEFNTSSDASMKIYDRLPESVNSSRGGSATSRAPLLPAEDLSVGFSELQLDRPSSNTRAKKIAEGTQTSPSLGAASASGRPNPSPLAHPGPGHLAEKEPEDLEEEPEGSDEEEEETSEESQGSEEEPEDQEERVTCEVCEREFQAGYLNRHKCQLEVAAENIKLGGYAEIQKRPCKVDTKEEVETKHTLKIHLGGKQIFAPFKSFKFAKSSTDQVKVPVVQERTLKLLDVKRKRSRCVVQSEDGGKEQVVVRDSELLAKLFTAFETGQQVNVLVLNFYRKSEVVSFAFGGEQKKKKKMKQN